MSNYPKRLAEMKAEFALKNPKDALWVENMRWPTENEMMNVDFYSGFIGATLTGVAFVPDFSKLRLTFSNGLYFEVALPPETTKEEATYYGGLHQEGDGEDEREGHLGQVRQGDREQN